MVEYPNPISKQNLKKTLGQMDNPFYKINVNKNKFGIALFCRIKYDNKSIPVMITNYEIINDIYLSNCNSIKISINDEI